MIFDKLFKKKKTEEPVDDYFKQDFKNDIFCWCTNPYSMRSFYDQDNIVGNPIQYDIYTKKKTSTNYIYIHKIVTDLIITEENKKTSYIYIIDTENNKDLVIMRLCFREIGGPEISPFDNIPESVKEFVEENKKELLEYILGEQNYSPNNN